MIEQLEAREVPATALFDYTGTVQTFVVPASVTSIEIEAAGAQGGGNGAGGGKGADIKGTFTVTPGETIYIVVGQQGLLQVGGDAQNSSGGGGGTFVYVAGPPAQPLIVAGGGGGLCNYTDSALPTSAVDGQITTKGAAGPNGGGAGGINGKGGAAGVFGGEGPGTPDAGGGTGWFTAGGGPFGGKGFNSWVGGPGYGGGGGGGVGGAGGFGGGGGGGNLYGGGGGGGGYSGGGGGTDPTHGGGGGSYNGGTNQTNTRGVETGDGFVQITYSDSPSGLRFDMKASVSAPAVEGWKKAWQGTHYSATTGYGWSQSSNVGGGGGGVLPPESGDPAVMSDYAYGVVAATFQVYVGAFQSASVKIYSYGTNPQGKPGVAAKIGNGPTSTLTTNGVLTITGQAGADGILNITFNRGTGKGLWIVSAIEVNAGLQ